MRKCSDRLCQILRVAVDKFHEQPAYKPAVVSVALI
jgi:hypothetical protein